MPGLPSPSGGELGVLAPLCLSLEPLAAALQEGPTQLKGGWGGAEGAGVTAEGRCCQALGFWPGFGLGFVHYLLLLLAPFPNTGWNPALSCWKVKQRVRVSLAPPPRTLCPRRAQLPWVPALVGKQQRACAARWGLGRRRLTAAANRLS